MDGGRALSALIGSIPSGSISEATTTSGRESTEEALSSPAPQLKRSPQDGASPLNLNQIPLPPPDLDGYHQHAIQQTVIHIVAISFAVAVLNRTGCAVGWGVLGVIVGISRLRKRLQAIKDEFGSDVERRRARQALDQSSLGESVEWINSIVKVVWPLISTDIMEAGIDLLEDTLQAQSPSIVNSVRVDDVAMGHTPIRLLSIKILPSDEPIVPGHSTILDEPGDYVNVEVEFAFRRAPPPAPQIVNAHCVGYFGVGVKKIANFELPVWVQLEGLHGSIRLRLQMISEPPFVRQTTFSFPKLPAVEIAAKPLHGPDVMSLPIISHFVTRSINIVLANFVAPASYTLDLSRILLGSDVLMQPRHIGVLAICVSRAYNLQASDLNGSSDPYVSISFCRFAKPLYSTRIILRSLHPQWEEIAFVRVSPDDVAEGESVRLTVWDSDRFSADDPLGKVEVPLQELVSHPGRVESRADPLSPYYPGYAAQGTLEWKVGFFGFINSMDMSTPGATPVHSIPQTANRQLSAEKQPREEEQSFPRASRSGGRTRVALDGRIPPSRENQSGILVVQIHQMADLEVPSTRGHVGGKKAGDVTAPDEGAEPSTYAFVCVNDEKVYETRVKKFARDPYINAGTERFIRDWPLSRVDVVVMDARMREHDAVMGVVALPLAAVFASRSQVTRWYPLVGGIGYGRVRISMLFQAVDVDTDRPLRGWNVGTLEILGVSIVGLGVEINGELELSAVSGASRSRMTTDSAAAEPMLKGGNPSPWGLNWSFRPRVRLPVTLRMQTALCIRLRTSAKLVRKEVIGGANVWLSTVADGETTTLELPLKERSTTLDQLQKNEPPLMPAQPTRDRRQRGLGDGPEDRGVEPQAPSPPTPEKPEGSPTTTAHIASQDPGSTGSSRTRSSSSSTVDAACVRVTLRFVPGVSAAHQHLASRDKALVGVLAAWQCLVDHGDRGSGGDAGRASCRGGGKGKAAASGPPERPRTPPGSEAEAEAEPRRRRRSSSGGATGAHGPSAPPSPPPSGGRPPWEPCDGRASSEWADEAGREDSSSDGGGGGSGRRRWYSGGGGGGGGGTGSEKRRSQVRYQRGPSQLKPVRTLRWVKDGVRGGVVRLKGSTQHNRARVPGVEKEHISSL